MSTLHRSDTHQGPGGTHIHLDLPPRREAAIRTIAVLGTGKMGSAIARRLAASGHELVIWNRTRSRAEALKVGMVVDTPGAAAGRADLIISSLTGPEAVLAAYLGSAGALAGGPGKHFVEMSTAGPALVAELGRHVASSGGTLIDAPLLGAPTVVQSGGASILVGGSDAAVAAASRVLATLGSVRRVGPLGSAARLKLVANSMLADVVVAAAELQVAGEDAGLRRDDVFWVLERIAPALAARKAGIVEDRHGPTQFAMRDLRKDLHLALDLFGSRATLPLTKSASAVVDSAAAAAPDLDISAVAQAYHHVAGRATMASQPRRLVAESAAAAPAGPSGR